MPTIRRSFCSPLVDCCDSKNDSSNARVNDSLAIVKTTISFTSRDCIDYILNSIQFFLAALVAQLVWLGRSNGAKSSLGSAHFLHFHHFFVILDCHLPSQCYLQWGSQRGRRGRRGYTNISDLFNKIGQKIWVKKILFTAGYTNLKILPTSLNNLNTSKN